MASILEVNNLVKHYRTVAAVNGISFTLPQGICFGLLGPNGAGKTTALEVIEGIISPTAGEVLYNGVPKTDSFREEVGIQFQHTTLLNFMTVRETILAFQSLYLKTESFDHLVEICKLHDILDQMNDKISGGQAQRLMLALALVNKPKLIFLMNRPPDSTRRLAGICGRSSSGKRKPEKPSYLPPIPWMRQNTCVMRSLLWTMAESLPKALRQI